MKSTMHCGGRRWIVLECETGRWFRFHPLDGNLVVASTTKEDADTFSTREVERIREVTRVEAYLVTDRQEIFNRGKRRGWRRRTPKKMESNRRSWAKAMRDPLKNPFFRINEERRRQKQQKGNQ